jgi:hypothetical protein
VALKWKVFPDPARQQGKESIRRAAKFFAEELQEPDRSRAEAEYARKIRKAIMEAKLNNDAIDASEQRILKGVE